MFWQKIVISGESGRNLVILHDSTENCSLARFWQKEWLSCNNLAKNGYFCKILVKKVYLARFWQKKVFSGESGINLVILHDSDRKFFSCKILAERMLVWQIVHNSDRNLSSCKILAEWMVILRDTDKNGYLGRLRQKEWLSCNNLAKNGYFYKTLVEKGYLARVVAKNCHFGRIRE